MTLERLLMASASDHLFIITACAKLGQQCLFISLHAPHSSSSGKLQRTPSKCKGEGEEETAIKSILRNG